MEWSGFASLGPARDIDAPSDIGQLYAINVDPDVDCRCCPPSDRNGTTSPYEPIEVTCELRRILA
jgi:hypothetical protein